MEEKMYEELLLEDQRLADTYQLIFSPYQASELTTLNKLLSALVEEDYCLTKQILAIKIIGILDITDLKNNYDLSEERLREIRDLAEQYDPSITNDPAGHCT